MRCNACGGLDVISDTTNGKICFDCGYTILPAHKIVRKFRIVLEEVKDYGLTAKQCNLVRNALSERIGEVHIQLAWANAMLDAGISNKEIN